MKLCVVFLVGLFALVISDQQKQEYKVADKTFLDKQKKVLELFYHVNQPSYFKDHIEIAKSYHFEDNVDHYKKPEVVKHFNQYWKYNPLHKGEVFSIFHVNHVEQAKVLFDLFYYAKDFDTFYKTAVWARQNVNEGLFVYTFSVAVVHRHDCHGIILPPIYEVYPHYFYNSEVIHEAYKYKQIHHHDKDHTNQGKDAHSKGYTITANYSGHYLNLHPEQSIAYYLEDVGINAFYYYYNLHYPYWLSAKEFGFEHDKRGELYYYVHQQLLARYYLERLSHEVGEIPWFNWDEPIETPYYSSLEYPNGLEFPNRPAFAKLHEYFYNYGQSWTTRGPYGYSYTFVRDYERRINDAIDCGHVYTHDGKKVDLHSEEGFNVLGNVIEGNSDSPHHKYYGCHQLFARHLLGYSHQPYDSHHIAPSALEHFETSLRDPAFYQYYKKIVGKFQRYKSTWEPYTEHDLHYPGVNVQKFEVDSLETYYDHFYADISNAVYGDEDELKNDAFHVTAKQYRLNHKPFTYKVTVKSDKDTKASVKVFLGPKYDEYGRYINISHNRLNFVEVDHFVHDLKSGVNTIKRNSYDNYWYGPDHTTYHELYKQVTEAHAGQQEFHIDGHQNHFHFPRRYLLPRGSHGGTPYQFYVIVYPYKPYSGAQQVTNEYHYPTVGSGAIHVDNYPVGYPFDRFIKFDELWHEIPNAHFHEVRVYHKHAEEINAPHH